MSPSRSAQTTARSIIFSTDWLKSPPKSTAAARISAVASEAFWAASSSRVPVIASVIAARATSRLSLSP